MHDNANAGSLERYLKGFAITVQAMATDQLTPAQKASSPFFPDFWTSRGWGLGFSVVTRRDDVSSSPGRFGWDGVFCTSLHVDPREDLVGVLMARSARARWPLDENADKVRGAGVKA